MDVETGTRLSWAAIVLIVLALPGCGGSTPSPGGPSTGNPPPTTPPGATTVRGTEWLGWNQSGYTSDYRFRAYVDDSPVPLDTATCSTSVDPPECSSPLPPLTDGPHTLSLAAVSPVAGEGPRSASLTLQKVSTAAAMRPESFPDAVPPGVPRLDAVLTAVDGQSFAVDVVARGLEAPLQLAVSADGRLFVAGADGRVRVVRPGQPEAETIALDGPFWLDPPPAGPLGLALHPDFESNRFVYLSFLSREQDQLRLRVVRLREVNDTLGEPATIYESPVSGASASRAVRGSMTGGPLLAFGPDRRLYVALPRGVAFDHEPQASRPRASMLRLRDDGSVAEADGLSNVPGDPLAFAWHPLTGELWAAFPETDGRILTRPVAAGPTSTDEGAERVLQPGGRRFQTSDAVVVNPSAPAALGIAQALRDAGLESRKGTIRLAVPIAIESLIPGVSGRISDVVVDDRGRIFAAAVPAAELARAGETSAVVLRLTPVPH